MSVRVNAIGVIKCTSKELVVGLPLPEFLAQSGLKYVFLGSFPTTEDPHETLQQPAVGCFPKPGCVAKLFKTGWVTYGYHM